MVEKVAVAAQGFDSFLNSRSARIVDSDYRAAGLYGQVDYLRDFLSVHKAKRAALNREVLGVDRDFFSVDFSKAGDDSVVWNVLFVHAKTGTIVADS